MGEKISELRLTLDRHGRQNSNSSAQWNFVTKNIFFLERTRYLHNWLWKLTDIFLGLWQERSAGLSKLYIKRQDRFLSNNNIIHRTSFVIFFRTLMRNVFGVLGEFFGSFFESAFYVSANFLWKYFFSREFFIFIFVSGLGKKEAHEKKSSCL